MLIPSMMLISFMVFVTFFFFPILIEGMFGSVDSAIIASMRIAMGVVDRRFGLTDGGHECRRFALWNFR